MNQEVLLLKCGELVLKGLNRARFEDRLLSIVRRRLSHLGEYEVYAIQSTLYVEPKNGAPVEEALTVCRKIFGVVAICRAISCPKDMDSICQAAVEYLKDTMEHTQTFRCQAKRSDKRFPLTSPEIARQVGGALLSAYPRMKVKMDGAQTQVHIEVRDKAAFVYADRIHGAGGMPTGTNGKAMLLLSGGIDSPVAGYMMAKRGLYLEGVHFFSYPYTSEEAKEKTLHLARILASYCGPIKVHVVPFTEIQDQIRKNCQEDLFTVLMRRFMMRIAQRVARRQDCGALVTGESLGQVASQTMEAIGVTNAVCELPVLRPAIGMDKEEIVLIARQIGTFETSILPYEDCCTVFTPRHPQTKPKLPKVLEEEQKLDVEGLTQKALEGVEQVICKAED